MSTALLCRNIELPRLLPHCCCRSPAHTVLSRHALPRNAAQGWLWALPLSGMLQDSMRCISNPASGHCKQWR